MGIPPNTIKDIPDCAGSTIRKLRQDRKISVKELANLTGETEASIRRIESGNRGLLSYTTIENFAAVLGCDVIKILGEQCNPSKAFIKEQVLVCIRSLARVMNAEEQRYKEATRQHHMIELVIGELVTALDQIKE